MLADLPGGAVVRRLYGRMVASVGAGVPWHEVQARLQRVFGLAWFSPSWQTPQDIDALEQAVVARVTGRDIGPFAVRCRRVDRRFAPRSQAVNERIGAAVNRATGAPVELDEPRTTIRIQVLHDRILYLFERHEGPGGLPVGVSGRALCLLSGGIDSPVAAWRLMRRGLRVDFVHFHSAPYTDAASQLQAAELATVLTRWQFHCRLHVVPFAETQRQIVTGAPAPLRVLLYRRFMLRIAEAIARRERHAALVTGEAVGQVASQTLSNLAAIEAVCDLPVLRPLVGSDKQDIIAIARRIGTFDISTEPHQDCCSYLMPRNPATRSRAAQLDAAEAALDVAALVAAPLQAASVQELTAPGYTPPRSRAGSTHAHG
jgi:thiamine biosynthesis protein ThiI